MLVSSSTFKYRAFLMLLVVLECRFLHSTHGYTLDLWVWGQIDITNLYIASRLASSSSSRLMVLLAGIFCISFCVGVAFSSSWGGVKVVNLSCFKLLRMSALFLYVVDAYNCSFSIAFKYRSGPFLATENSTLLSSSSTSQSARFVALFLPLCFFLLNFGAHFFLHLLCFLPWSLEVPPWCR